MATTAAPGEAMPISVRIGVVTVLPGNDNETRMARNGLQTTRRGRCLSPGPAHPLWFRCRPLTSFTPFAVETFLVPQIKGSRTLIQSHITFGTPAAPTPPLCRPETVMASDNRIFERDQTDLVRGQ